MAVARRERKLHRGHDADAGADLDQGVHVLGGETAVFGQDGLQVSDGLNLRDRVDGSGVGDLHGLFSLFFPFLTLGRGCVWFERTDAVLVFQFYHDDQSMSRGFF
jgi:hypothetical protein